MVPKLLTHILLDVPENIRKSLVCYAKIRESLQFHTVFFSAEEYLKFALNSTEEELHTYTLYNETEICLNRATFFKDDHTSDTNIVECGLLRWMLLCTNDRIIQPPMVFNSLEAAREKMCDAFAEATNYSRDALSEFTEEYPDECEIADYSAKLNKSVNENGNFNWKIMPCFQRDIFTFTIDRSSNIFFL